MYSDNGSDADDKIGFHDNEFSSDGRSGFSFHMYIPNGFIILLSGKVDPICTLNWFSF